VTLTLDDIADLDAEADSLGGAVDSAEGCRLLVDHGVTASDYVHPGHRAVFAAAVDIGDVRGVDWRICAIAGRSGYSESFVRSISENPNRTRMRDSSGELSREVRASGARWRRVLALIAELEDLGVRRAA
jgi:hypothetical protein